MLPPLIAFLGANITQFKAKMAEAGAVAEATTAKSSSTFSKFATAGKVAMIAAAAGLVLVAGTAFELEKHAEEAGQAAYEMSEKFGLTGKQASLWTQIAARVGIDAGGMSNAFRFLTRNMENVNLAMKSHLPDARAVMESSEKLKLAQDHYNLALKDFGPHSDKTKTALIGLQKAQDSYNKTSGETQAKLTPAGAALQELGINVFDAHGKLRSANDVMRDAVIAFGKMKDGPEKAGLAMKLFGRSGQDLLPLLNQGKAGLDELTKAAIASGAVMGDQDVDAAHQAFLAHKAFDQSVTGLTNSLAIGLLPVAAKVFGWLSSTAVPAIQNAVNWTKNHTDVIKIVAAAIAGPLLLAIGAYIVSMAAAAVATIAVIWPILLIIGALALLGVGIYLLVTHWKEITNFLSSTWRTVVAWVGNSFSQLGTTVRGFFTGVLSLAASAWAEFSSRPIYWIARLVLLIPQLLIALILKVGEWAGDLRVWGQKAANWFFAAVGDVMQKLPGAVWGFLGNVVDAIGRKIQDFRTWGQNVANAFFNAVANIDWLGLGKSIIEGIVNGIKNTISSEWNNLQNSAKQIGNAFKDAFGIKSPSSVMAKEVGKPIAEGVAMGIQQNTGVAVQAASAMKALVSSAASGSATFSGSGSIASGSTSNESSSDLAKRLDQIIALLNGTASRQGPSVPVVLRVGDKEFNAYLDSKIGVALAG